MRGVKNPFPEKTFIFWMFVRLQPELSFCLRVLRTAWILVHGLQHELLAHL